MLEVAPFSAARGGPNGSNTAGKDPGIGAIAGDPPLRCRSPCLERRPPPRLLRRQLPRHEDQSVGGRRRSQRRPLQGAQSPSRRRDHPGAIHLMPMTLDPVAKKSRSADGRPARWHAVLLGWGVRAVFKGVAAGRSGAVASYRAVSMARWKWFLTSAFSPCSARYRTWSVILGSLMSASHKSTALVTS